jgi:sulfur relay (sulfurtransferase) complex TusBCD TusD component (DsrE family)
MEQSQPVKKLNLDNPPPFQNWREYATAKRIYEIICMETESGRGVTQEDLQLYIRINNWERSHAK